MNRIARLLLAGRWLALLFVMGAVGLAGGTPAADPAAALRIEQLRAEIAHHDDLYFRQAAPEITDYEYDLLKAELHRLEQSTPATGAGTETIGDDRVAGGQRVVHRHPMLSLDKAYSAPEVAAFLDQVQRATGQKRLALVLEPKFDGIAVSVVFHRGQLVQASTRGDGATGDDITAQVRAVRSLGYEWSFDEGVVGAAAKIETIELRGEVYLTDAAFARLNADREAAEEDLFQHPRNVAAGTIKLDDLAAVQARGLSIVFHGWGDVEPATAAPPSVHAFQLWLAAVGLPGVEDGVEIETADPAEVEAAVRQVRAAITGYPTDGVVIKVDDVALQQRCGAGPTAPRWALARKFPPPRAATRLRDVSWQVGRTGVITPVAEFDPVELAGARIRRASLHNAAEIARRDLRIGDQVWIEKAGEIIPVVAGVDLTRRPGTAVPLILPRRCPSCGGSLVAEADGAELRCPAGAACPAQCAQRLAYFASRAAVGIRGLGPALATKLVVADLVRSPADLYALDAPTLARLPGVGATTAERLVAAIDASRAVEPWRVVAGLGIEGVGPQAARDLAAGMRRLSDMFAAPALATAAADPVLRDTVRRLEAAGVGELAAGADL